MSCEPPMTASTRVILLLLILATIALPFAVRCS